MVVSKSCSANRASGNAGPNSQTTTKLPSPFTISREDTIEFGAKSFKMQPTAATLRMFKPTQKLMAMPVSYGPPCKLQLWTDGCVHRRRSRAVRKNTRL